MRGTNQNTCGDYTYMIDNTKISLRQGGKQMKDPLKCCLSLPNLTASFNNLPNHVLGATGRGRACGVDSNPSARPLTGVPVATLQNTPVLTHYMTLLGTLR